MRDVFLQAMENMGINLSTIEGSFIPQPHTSKIPYSSTPVNNLNLPPPIQALHRTKRNGKIRSDITPKSEFPARGSTLAVLDRCMQHMASAHLIAEDMIKMEGKAKYKKCKFYE